MENIENLKIEKLSSNPHWTQHKDIAFGDLKGHGGGLLVKSEVPHAVVPLHVIIVDHDHDPCFVLVAVVHIGQFVQGGNFSCFMSFFLKVTLRVTKPDEIAPFFSIVGCFFPSIVGCLLRILLNQDTALLSHVRVLVR